MTEFGRTQYHTAAEFSQFGYQVVIYPVSALRVAAKAMSQLFETIFRDGTQQAAVPHMQTRQEVYQTIGYFDYEALDSRIARSVFPKGPPDEG